ncbi:MAG TPA: hypothetical protein VLT36_22745 [Candidatus Dormibacteraeota bacterium]|nr:hypothetical protein [Candidatus Dormibacteraeota bacterium]
MKIKINNEIDRNQMNLGLPAAAAAECRRPLRRSTLRRQRARAWFERMREIVDAAPDPIPAVRFSQFVS